MSSIEQDVYEMLVTYIVENQDKFYRLAFSYAHNQEDALDIVQNAMCKALENYQNLNNQRAIRTWMYHIVVNESLQLLKAREREVLSGEDGKWIALEDVLGADYAALATEQVRQQAEALAAETGVAYELEQWQGVTADTSFYMNADGNPVVVLEKYEIAPGAEGRLEFEITQ